MKEASYYRKLENSIVRCELCPHYCQLKNDETGKCNVRQNRGGVLYTLNYGCVSSMNLDPLEKKPLYHFFPGKTVFSIGTYGCNLKCRFCQNCKISQVGVPAEELLNEFTSRQLVMMAAAKKDSVGIAFTYNEPSVWIEFVEEVAELSHASGLRNILVTNGFINPGPLQRLTEIIDAFSVDLKAFGEDFYRTQTQSALSPVLKSLEIIRNSGRHLEIVNLVIPGLNDDEFQFEMMCEWIAQNLGKNSVLHISGYFPTYKAEEPATPPDLLHRFHLIASNYLDFVYIGNSSRFANNTCCPDCGNMLVSRRMYNVDIHGVNEKGSCNQCGLPVFQNF